MKALNMVFTYLLVIELNTFNNYCNTSMVDRQKKIISDL